MIPGPRHAAIVATTLWLIASTAADTNTTWPVQTYKTANFTPPVLDMSQKRPRARVSAHEEAEYIFIAPDGTPAQNPDVAPLIMDSQGELVWNGPAQHAFAFGVQEYQGEKVLVGWNGSVFPEPVGRGNGVVTLWDKHYEPIAQVSLPGDFLELEPGVAYPSNLDLHEIFISENGTLIATANNVTRADLTSVGGPAEGWVVEAQVYAVDIATNEVVFSWKSLDHLDAIPLEASLYPLGSEGYDGSTQSLAWGYFHINAASPYRGGYLLSSRYLCSAIALEASGEVAWVLQGRRGGYFNDFTLGEGADFCYQHDIRAVSSSTSLEAEEEEHPHQHSPGHRPGHRHSPCDTVTLQLHDNHNSPIDNNTVPSSGKLLSVDLTRKHVSLQQRFLNATGPIFSTAQGNVQRTRSGSVFIGHGWVPVLEEFSAAAAIVNTVQFGATPAHPGGGFLSSPLSAVTLSYRAFKQAWTGCPRAKPAVVAERIGDSPTARVFVSWNGATEVEGWRVYGGKREEVVYIKSVAKSGFEMVVEIFAEEVEVVQVRPVLRRGASRACGRDTPAASNVVPVSVLRVGS